MHKPLTSSAILFVAMTATFAAGAADPSAGRTLHDEHCLKCHASNVYTREQRRVTSLQGLREQVKRCEVSLGLTWFDDQIEDVVHYLNDSYYGFH